MAGIECATEKVGAMFGEDEVISTWGQWGVLGFCSKSSGNAFRDFRREWHNAKVGPGQLCHILALFTA